MIIYADTPAECLQAIEKFYALRALAPGMPICFATASLQIAEQLEPLLRMRRVYLKMLSQPSVLKVEKKVTP